MSLNTKAYDKVYAKIKTIENEIKEDQFDIDNGLATRFVPKELHISALELQKKRVKNLRIYTKFNK